MIVNQMEESSEMSGAAKISNRPTGRSLGSRFLRLSIAVAIAIIVLGSLEAGAWVQQYYKFGMLQNYRPIHLFDFYRFYRVNPEYGSETVRLNSTGFRNDEEITPAKPSNVIRIVMMGGSTVWGSDAHLPFAGTIDNRDTMAAHLEAILNAQAVAQKRNVKVQVINAGIVGYLLFQDFIYFNHVIAHYHPDIVIAMDGHNDLDALQFGLKPYHHMNQVVFEQGLNDPKLSDVYRELLRCLESRSLFVRKVSNRFGEWMNQQALSDMWKRRYERPPSEPQVAASLAEYIDTVRRFDASVRVAGARALFVVQAEALGERHKSLTSTEKDIQQHWKPFLWLHTVVRDRLVAQLEQAGREHGIWTANVSDTFKDASGQVYLDYTHLSSYGSRLMAERLANIIEKEVFKPL